MSFQGPLGPTYFGEFDHTIDRKLRVSVPAPLRRSLGKEGVDEVTVRPGIDRCLYAGTDAQMAALTQQIGQARRGSDGLSRSYHTWAGSLSSKGGLDDQGRLQLSRKQVEYAGLVDRVIIVGCFDHFELWSEAHYREHLEKAKAQNMDWSALAEHALSDEPPPREGKA